MKDSLIKAILLAAFVVTPLQAALLGQTTRLYFSYELQPQEKPGARFWNNTTPLEPNELSISTGYKWDPDNPLVGVLEFRDTNQVKTFQWSSNINERPSRECRASFLYDPGVEGVAWSIRESHAVGNGIKVGALPGAFSPDTNGPRIDGVQVVCDDVVQ